MVASHLPLLLDRDERAAGHAGGPHGPGQSAVAETPPAKQVLAIFSGPHAYISPQWYEATEVVPTWNYVAVHAYGRLELIEDAAATRGAAPPHD